MSIRWEPITDDAAALRVETMMGEDDPWSYTLLFSLLTPRDVLGMIAETIDHAAGLGVDMTSIPGPVFIASLLFSACEREAGTIIAPPLPHRDAVPCLILHASGGVSVLYGTDDEPVWDPTLFVMRYGNEVA